MIVDSEPSPVTNVKQPSYVETTTYSTEVSEQIVQIAIHSDSGSRIANPDDEASQSAINQLAVGLSTPELSSGTSLEEQFSTPIPNNIAEFGNSDQYKN